MAAISSSKSSSCSDEDGELGTELFTTGMTSIDHATMLSNTNTKNLDIDRKFKQYVKKQYEKRNKPKRKSVSPDHRRSQSRGKAAKKEDEIVVNKPAILPSNGTSSSLNYTKFSNTLQ